MKLIKITKRQIVNGRIRQVGEIMPVVNGFTRGETIKVNVDLDNKAKITNFKLAVKEVKPKEINEVK